MDLLDDARSLHGELAQLREALHRSPEVGLQVPRTRDRVLAALDGLPLEISTGTATTSVVAVLRGASPGPTVLLRGDMDGLPVAELSGEPFASTTGLMHACGHDLHTASLVGAAHLLSAQRLAGDVVFMFQPGEEGHDGAGVMIDEGVLTAAGRPADHAYALHVTSNRLRHGVVSGRPGTMLTAVYRFDVTVRGTGGHSSAPHEARDPIAAAGAMLGALQLAVTRALDAYQPVVVTVGVVRAGTAINVIPDTATFGGTVRTAYPENEERIREVLTRALTGTAAAHGVEVEVEMTSLFPATVNDAAEAAFAADVVRNVLGERHFALAPGPASGSEDFSRVLERVPGALFMLGACPPGIDPTRAERNHSPRARFDSGVLAPAAALLAGLAVGRLANPVRHNGVETP